VMLSTEQDEQIVSFVSSLRKPLGKSLIALGLRGSRARAVRQKRLSDNPAYGRLTGVPEASIVLAIERLLRTGRLAPRGRKYPTVWLPDKRVNAVRSTRTSTTATRRPPLERALRSLRQREAKRRRVKSYQVFADRTIAGILAAHPQDVAALEGVWGMGGKRLGRYADAILDLVRTHGPIEE
jgi:ATP-dependent DNA helicase RecQ